MEKNRKFTTSELDSTLSQSNEDTFLSNPSEYQHLVVRLIYLTITRPEICYSVQTLSHFMHAPKKSHLDAAIHIVKYIKKHPGQGIIFQPSTSLSLTAFCDSDWAVVP